MRVIAGRAGGIPIQAPRATTRPTTDRVRESLFASLGNLLPGARVLDLYAGSGSLGIEALSRGAERATFVECERRACEVIEKNLEKARLEGGVVRCSQVLRFLRGHRGHYSLIFADPPYALDQAAEAEIESLAGSEQLPELLEEGGVLILESLAESSLPEAIWRNWDLRDERCYGKTRVSFLARNNNNGE